MANAKDTPPVITGNKTRGERNNNPGNIRFDSRWTWKGQVSQDSGGYLIFDYPENGIRAIVKDLLSKFARGLNTVYGIISVYAPPSENNTKSYIDAVSSALGVSSTASLDLMNTGTMRGFVRAIIKHENGRIIYTDATINEGVTRALS